MTGHAVFGSPMSKASVVFTSLVDTTTSQLTAADDGAFTVPSGVTYPILVKATSVNGAHTHWGYISSASQAQVAVNPLTSALIALAANAHPSTVTTAIAPATLDAAKTKLNTIIGNLVTSLGITVDDFLATTFTANHTGLDLLLDVVGLDLIQDGSIAITNRAEGGSQTVSSGSVTALPFSTNSAALAGIHLAECTTAVTNLTSDKLINDPAPTVYDASFKESGANKAAYQALISGAVSSTSAFNVTMPSFQGEDGNGNLLFSAVLVNPTTKQYMFDWRFTMKWDGTASRCLLAGNQYPFNVSVEPAIKRIIRLDGVADHHVPTAVNGIEVQIGAFDSDPAGRANTDTGLTGGVPVMSVRVDVCTSTNAASCSNLATMSRQLTKTGANDKGTFLIDGSPHDFMNMKALSSGTLITGQKNPIKVSFFSTASAPTSPSDDTGKLGVSVYVKAMGNLFSTTEYNAITLPSVDTPSQDMLKIFTDMPALAYDSGSGVLGTVTRQSANPSVKTKTVLVMSKGTGTAAFTGSTDFADASYRSIIMKGSLLSRRGIIETKYIYAPGNSVAY